MTGRRKMQIGIDLLMVVLLPFLMAYSLVGEKLHEWLGLGMLLLVVFHHYQNRYWYKSIFRGKYQFKRICNNLIDILLLIDIVMLGVSGIMMSRYIFDFLMIQNGMAFARNTHLFCAYWGFLLMCFHAGHHLGGLTKVLSRILLKAWHKKVTLILVVVIAVYGVCAMITRNVWQYLFLQTKFVFFDYEEPIAFFLMDMFTIMVLFAAVGHCVAHFPEYKKNVGDKA